MQLHAIVIAFVLIKACFVPAVQAACMKYCNAQPAADNDGFVHT